MYVRTSKSYLKLREQIQESFNFVYIVCQSVPCLKLQSSLVKKGQLQKLPNPDYYQNPNPLDQISNQVKDYKGELSKFVLLSSFSYFESYFVDILKELIEFLGGPEKMEKRAEISARTTIKKQSENFTKQKRHLSKNDDKHHDRKRKATRELKEVNYIFPSSLLSSFGVKSLIQKMGNIKSVDIPKLLTDGFHMDLSETDIEKFHSIRDMRNKIAHGNNPTLVLKEVIEMNNFLREFAKSIDSHLIESFFILEEYV